MTKRRRRPSRWDERLTEARPDLLSYTPDAVRRIFTERGISDDVRDARPYTPYHAGDWATVLAADPGFAAQAIGTRRKINQRPGIVMNRAGYGKSSTQLAQLRPFKFKELDPELDLAPWTDGGDDGVWLANEYHDHAEPEIHTHRHPESGAWQITTLNGSTRHGPAGVRRDIEDHVRLEHSGANVDGAHAHPRDYTDHVAGDTHGGANVRGKHKHEHRAKYLYPAGEKPRVDVHPDAWPLLSAGGEVCYFALEGLLKNDSILSTGAPVLNVGSVTLWHDPVLPELCDRYLKGFELVVVVPDSDWSGNSAVSTQADGLSGTLRRYGVTSIVAAPPPTCSRTVCQHLTRHGDLPASEHKRGVDDFLGDGGALRDMLVVARNVDNAPAVPWRRSDQHARDAAILEYLRESAGVDGLVIATRRGMAAGAGSTRDGAGNALRSLERAGVLRFEDSTWWTPPAKLGKPPVTAVRLAPKYRPARALIPLGEYIAGRRCEPARRGRPRSDNPSPAALRKRAQRARDAAAD